MIKKLDINADLGESYGRFLVGNDAELMPYLTSCNIACGFHGGDPLTIKKTIDLALTSNVRIGAHPSFPDLLGFGRRKITMTPEELEAAIIYQVAAIKGMVEAQGARLHHVKAHGALYHEIVKSPSTWKAFESAVIQIDPNLIIYLPYIEGMSHAGNIAFEAFADRQYENDLTLTPRNHPDSMIASDQLPLHLTRLLKEGKVLTRQKEERKLPMSTLCIHGDHEGALEVAKQIHLTADELPIEITAL